MESGYMDDLHILWDSQGYPLFVILYSIDARVLFIVVQTWMLYGGTYYCLVGNTSNSYPIPNCETILKSDQFTDE